MCVKDTQECTGRKAQSHLGLQLGGSLEKEYGLFVCVCVCVLTQQKNEREIEREIKKTARRQPQERVKLF